MGEKGFVVVCWTDFFFVVILSQLTAVGFARRGSTRSSEGRFPSSRSSPPATGNGLLPALRAKRLLRTGCVAYFFFYGQAAASSRFRRAFAEGEQLVSLPSATEVLHATAKRAQRRGFLGGACGLRNFELAPPKGFLSLQTETKLQLKSTIKNILQSSYIKNDNPH